MVKYINVIFIFFILSSFAYAQEEITVTTYYPSPYGSYHEVRSQRMAIGDTYYDAGTYPWGSAISNDADLVVEGRVGVMTATPSVALEVRGRIMASGTSYVPLSCTALVAEDFQSQPSCSGTDWQLAAWCSGNCDSDDAKTTICCKSEP